MKKASHFPIVEDTKMCIAWVIYGYIGDVGEEDTIFQYWQHKYVLTVLSESSLVTDNCTHPPTRN